jgi:isopenicillin-N N-acyltransferase-like protein
VKVIRLCGASHREIGRAHGEGERAGIAELAEIRLELLERRSTVRGRDRLLALAAAHLPVLEQASPALRAELAGISEGSGVSEDRLVVLNHYTDIRDIRAEQWADGGGIGCSIVFVPRPGGGLLGQTWDMHASAEPYVRVLDLRPPGGPPVVALTVAGCLGMVALNAYGVAVAINNLTPTDGRVGLLWPALVRMMMGEASAAGALEVLRGAHLGSGHNYLIADAEQVYNVETTGLRKKVTADNPTRPFFHTNHYLDAELQALEAPLYPTSTTHDRYRLLDARLNAATPGSAQDLMRLLGDHEGMPRSICSHVRDEDDPSASKTCGAVVIDLAARALFGAAGCVHDTPFQRFEVTA